MKLDFDWNVTDMAEGVNSSLLPGFIVARDVCRAAFHDDLKRLRKAEPLLTGTVDPGDQGAWCALMAALFQSWRDDVPPTMPALLALACRHFAIPVSHPLVPAALAACILAEMPHDNPYHSTAHFREVFAMVVRLCATHNALEEGGLDRLYPSDILLALTAAAIHDFMHDGTDNTVKGERVTSRLEALAFARAEPFLEAAGGMAYADRLAVRALVLATDAGGGPGGTAGPAETVRQLARMRRGDLKTAPYVPDSMKVFTKDKKLALIALILCESDIAPSTGLSYDFALRLTRLVMAETGMEQASPEAVLAGFMDDICKGGYDCAPARYLMGDMYEDIRAKAASHAG